MGFFFPAIGSHKWENKPQIQNIQIKLTGKLNSLRKKCFVWEKVNSQSTIDLWIEKKGLRERKVII